jgi:hypothetical protein
MDNIWRKAAKNIRKHKETLSAIQTGPETKPAAIAATTTTPTHTNPAIFALTEENMNTVEKIDAQLARMERNWAKTRSGPFPERARNAIAKLRASLEEQDTETIPPSQPADLVVDVRHVTTTTITTLPAPTNTATPAIYETTTTIPAHNNTSVPATSETTATPERLDQALDV